MIGENKMKKCLSIILSLCFVLCLPACSKDNTASDVMSNNSQITSTENQTSDLTNSNEPTETSEPIESSKPTETSKPIESSKPTKTNKPTHTHEFSAATCTEASKCSCGATGGSALGHNYNKGVCSRCGNKDSNYIEYVTIPNFVGLSKNDAEKLATSLGLKIAFITDTYSPEYKENVIVKQSSEKDVLMTKGATITLSVNNCVYKYFNFKIIDGTVTVSNRLFGGAVPDDDSALPYMENDTYIIVSLNKEDLPSTLIIPETYNGKRITAIQRGLLGDCKVKTVILPKTIKAIGGNFCGSGCTCPSLEKLILTNTTPCYLGSLAFTDAQLLGGCKIYVPDESVEKYKSSEIGDLHGFPFKTYADLIFPISSLDEATKNLIS